MGDEDEALSSFKNITIEFGDLQQVELSVDVKDFNLSSFEIWVRSRYPLKVLDCIIYQNTAGQEVLPSSNYFRRYDSVKIVTHNATTSTAAISKQHKPKSHPFVAFLREYGAAMLVGLLSATLFMTLPMGNKMIDPAWKLDSILGRIGMSQYKRLVVDAFSSFLASAVCTLFIRRLLNPETSQIAFEKYSADAIFGGFSSAANVIVKQLYR